MQKHRDLTTEEIDEFEQVFRLVDTDGGGSIDKSELKRLLVTLRLNPSDAEIDAMMKEVDADGNGDIDFDEFVAVMSRRVEADYTPEQLAGAFKVYETDAAPPGHISSEQLIVALTKYGTHKLSIEEAEEVLATVDPERTGKLNYMDFVAMMSS